MREPPIGIMDSGSGGLSVWRALVSLLPYESITYVGDHAHLPYSQKTTQYIRKRVQKIIAFLLRQGVKLVVVACNTATVAGIDYYRKLFPDLPIVGVVPVIKTAAQTSVVGRFIVLSTPYTAKSAYQRELIRIFAQGHKVYNIGCMTLVRRIEQGMTSGLQIRKELKKILQPALNHDCDVVVLGCTHFPFLRDEIHAIVGEKVQILDSCGAVARHVARVLTNNGTLAPVRVQAEYRFYTTGNPNQVQQTVRTLLGIPVNIRYAKL